VTTWAQTGCRRVARFSVPSRYSQIIVDEADEPNSLVHLLDAEALSGQDGGDVDFLAVDADTATGGDEDVAVVEGNW
jgi:hypothetical protein